MAHDDRSLMRLILQHDQTALSQLYERYGTRVFSVAYRVLQSRYLAEEATQDTFLKVWRQQTTWDPDKGRLLNWLLVVARYTAIDHLRREQRLAASVDASLDELPEPMAEGGRPEDIHDRHHLYALLAELPDEQRQLIDLAFFQGMTHRELAERLNLPLGTVKTRVRLGLQKLRGLWLQAERESYEKRNPER
jgi:RNA polymerase sigma-70 factor, ECF subfamily